ncbi:TPA: hypothetical protein ACOKTJ_002083 [Streptococcus pneumoniae]|nr:Uncharacterised protein [Streptococcus pneumoniae]
MEHQEVIDWLRYCDENNIKPWEWDFKNCYSDTLTPDSITNFLKYKNGELTDPTTFRVTELLGKGADCDKEAFYLYKCLGWQNSENCITRGETLNSYLTTFTRSITKTPHYKSIYKKIGIDEEQYLNEQYPTLYNNNNYENFIIIKENKEQFKKFAKLTHTIGNFTVLPHWINTGRYNFSKDYWDITMLSLQEWLNLLPNDTWKCFVDAFYLQPYVNEQYETELFWEGHTSERPNMERQHFPIFLKKVNERIEERGKFIIKQICDKLDQKDFNFYKEIENMDKIKFSNKF